MDQSRIALKLLNASTVDLQFLTQNLQQILTRSKDLTKEQFAEKKKASEDALSDVVSQLQQLQSILPNFISSNPA